MASAGSIRSRRLAGTIRKHLSVELGRDIADPRLAGVSLQDVELTSDLGLATVVVRIDYGDDGPEARKALLDLLQRIGPRLRASLAPQLRMRRVPELRFGYDAGQDDVRAEAEALHHAGPEDAQRASSDEPSSREPDDREG